MVSRRRSLFGSWTKLMSPPDEKSFCSKPFCGLPGVAFRGPFYRTRAASWTEASDHRAGRQRRGLIRERRGSIRETWMDFSLNECLGEEVLNESHNANIRYAPCNDTYWPQTLPLSGPFVEPSTAIVPFRIRGWDCRLGRKKKSFFHQSCEKRKGGKDFLMTPLFLVFRKVWTTMKNQENFSPIRFFLWWFWRKTVNIRKWLTFSNDQVQSITASRASNILSFKQVMIDWWNMMDGLRFHIFRFEPCKRTGPCNFWCTMSISRQD